MKRWVRALAALVEVSDLIPRAPTSAHNHLYLNFLGVITFSRHLWYHMHMVTTHTCRETNTHTHKMNVTMSKKDLKK